MDPADRLRAFEDKVLGKDVGRIDGKVERGIGSRYSQMKPDQRAAHAALEELVDADQAVLSAMRALGAAKVRMATAETTADAVDPSNAPPPAAPKLTVVESLGFEE